VYEDEIEDLRTYYGGGEESDMNTRVIVVPEDPNSGRWVEGKS
jgi:hypothetical protein